MVRPTLIDLNSDELHYYPFMISMNWFNGNCNIVEVHCGGICVPDKMEDVNLKVFNF